MNPAAEALKQRTKQFALDVLRLVRTLPFDAGCRVIASQLAASGTSVASNYRAACRGRSRAEFVAKLGLALEEAAESLFWLEVIKESGTICGSESHRLLGEANELTAILTASIITARQRLRE